MQLHYRQVIGAFTMFTKVVNNSALDAQFLLVRHTRHRLRFNVHAFNNMFLFFAQITNLPVRLSLL